MYSAIETLSVFYEVVFVAIYLKKFFGHYRVKTWKFVAYCVMGGAGYLLLRFLPVTPLIRFGYIIIYMTVIVKPLFGTTFLNGFSGAMLFITINTLSNLIGLVVIMCLGYPAHTMMKQGAARLLCTIVVDVLLAVFVLITAKVLKNRAELNSLKEAIPVLAAQVCGFLITMLIISAFLYSGLQLSNSIFTAVCGILLIDIMLFVFVDRLRLAAEVRQQSALDYQQLVARLGYFEQLKQDQEETRALWHDIGKYLNTMHKLLESHDLVQARHCVNQVTAFFGDIGRVVDVGNTVVSAILNHTVQKTRYLGFEIALDVRIPPELAVSPADLSVIVGATCDSVLETAARLKYSKPMVLVRMVLKNKILFYEVRLRSGRQAFLKTGLKDRLGFKLAGVKRSVDKYDGTMLVEATPSAYAVTVSLNVPSVFQMFEVS